jgi:hypothetical protein
MRQARADGSQISSVSKARCTLRSASDAFEIEAQSPPKALGGAGPRVLDVERRDPGGQGQGRDRFGVLVHDAVVDLFDQMEGQVGRRALDRCLKGHDPVSRSSMAAIASRLGTSRRRQGAPAFYWT